MPLFWKNPFATNHALWFAALTCWSSARLNTICMELRFSGRQRNFSLRWAVFNEFKIFDDSLPPMLAIRALHGFFQSHRIFYSHRGVVFKGIRGFPSSGRPPQRRFWNVYLMPNSITLRFFIFCRYAFLVYCQKWCPYLISIRRIIWLVAIWETSSPSSFN